MTSLTYIFLKTDAVKHIGTKPNIHISVSTGYWLVWLLQALCGHFEGSLLISTD